MGNTRKFGRYFYPWDALQLSEDVDSGLRVSKNSISPALYRTFARQIHWTPMLSCSLALFAPPEDQLAFLSSFMRQISKGEQKRSLTFELYDFGETRRSKYEPLDDEFPGFRYHPFPEPLSMFIAECEKYVRDMRRESIQQTGAIEPPNKRLQILGLSLTPANVFELKNTITATRFVSLLENSSRARIYPFILHDDIRELSLAVLNAADDIMALGEEQAAYLRERVFPDMELGRHSFSQVEIGLMKSSAHDRLLPLHPLKFTPTQWHLDRDADRKAEEELYQEYLDSLYDGTDE